MQEVKQHEEKTSTRLMYRNIYKNTQKEYKSGSQGNIRCFRGNVKKKHSIFKDIVQIEIDPPPSHPIFDKFIFDTLLIMFTSLPPIEFLTKIMKFYALKHTFSIIPITFWG